MNKNDILEAHVQFELERLHGDNLHATIGAEVANVFVWLKNVQISELISPLQVLELIRRHIVEAPRSDELVTLIKENVLVAFESMQEDSTRLEEIFPRPLYDRMVDNLEGMQSARSALVHQVVTSSVYSLLIADVLYHGIKNFILTENSVARNLRGASSLLKFGQNALSAAAPQLEKGIDRQLISFINANIKDTIRESEDFLNRSLDDALLHKIGEEVWVANASDELAQVSGHVTPLLLDTTVELCVDFWMHYRQTQSFQEILAGIVRSFFLHYGRQDVTTWLAGLGITEITAAQGIYALAVPVVEYALSSGDYERSVRRRLDAFYSAYFASLT